MLEKEPDGWAARMQQLLLTGRDTAAHGYETTAAWDALLESVLNHYESLPPSARGRYRSHNLVRVLWQEREACLRFLADPAVPFTNNRAERALQDQGAHEDCGVLPHANRG